MKQRFIRLFPKNADTEWGWFWKEYNTGRYYHTLNHIESCLGELDEMSPEMEIAILYHDYVYDVHSHYNEANSAQVAYDTCIRNGYRKYFAEHVARMILATDHKTLPVTEDGKLIADIDIAIFGKPWKDFEAYENGIRKEYSYVVEDIYRSYRIKVLESFLNRDHIYHTDVFKKLYEQKARENLTKNIGILK